MRVWGLGPWMSSIWRAVSLRLGVGTVGSHTRLVPKPSSGTVSTSRASCVSEVEALGEAGLSLVFGKVGLILFVRCEQAVQRQRSEERSFRKSGTKLLAPPPAVKFLSRGFSDSSNETGDSAVYSHRTRQALFKTLVVKKFGKAAQMCLIGRQLIDEKIVRSEQGTEHTRRSNTNNRTPWQRRSTRRN